MRRTELVLLLTCALAAAFIAAPGAGAYESKDAEDVEGAAPREPGAEGSTRPPEGGYAPKAPEGRAGGDNLRANEIAVLVTGKVLDVRRGSPLPLARVLLWQEGGPRHEIGTTDHAGAIRVRYTLKDPPALLVRPPHWEGPPRVSVRIALPGYLDHDAGGASVDSLPRKGRFALIDLGEVRMRPIPPSQGAP